MIPTPYLLFLGSAETLMDIKTATGVHHWRPELCAGQYRLEGASVDLGLPEMTPAAAREAGVRSMLLGAANEGGYLDPAWMPAIEEALAAGLDVVSGLHERLCDKPALVAAAARHGVSLHDVRTPAASIPIATGARRSGQRLLTVGTDCVVGKMFTALSLERELRARGIKADFRATGQTGILIAGSGVPLDAVVSDFLAGAAEAISPANEADHWDLVEGQGALGHPLYGGVTLGLVHGAQPTAMVLCHDAGRSTLDGLPDYPIGDLRETISEYERAAHLTSPGARVIGVSVNTSSMEGGAALTYLAELEGQLGLPVVDAVRTGVGPLVDILEAL